MESAFDNISVRGSAMAHDAFQGGGASLASPQLAAAGIPTELLASVTPQVFLSLLKSFPGGVVLKTVVSESRTAGATNWRYVFSGGGIAYVCITGTEMDLSSSNCREVPCLGVLYGGKILGRAEQG